MSDELTELRAEMARLQSRIDAYEQDAEAKPVARRNMLRALGAAGAGAAVGGLALANPASAADGDAITAGQQTGALSPTRIFATSSYSSSPEAVGVLHVTNDTSQTDSQLAGSCISAYANSSEGGGLNTAFVGSGSAYGAKLDAPTPLKLLDSSESGPPGSTGYTGQFRVDGGDLYYCVSHNGLFGEDAVWKKIVGPGADAPVFYPITPYRAYDSRFGGGTLAVDSNRTNSVADAIDVVTGATTTTDAIPSSTTAIAFNLTAVSPTNRGNLSLTPASATEVTAASLNYQSTTTAIGNAGISAVSGDRQVKVFCSGSAGHAVHYVIDVTGYWA